MHAIATKSIYKDKCGFSLNEEVVARKIGSTSLSPVDQIHQCQCLRLRRSEGPVNEEVDAQEAVAKNGVNLIVTRGAAPAMSILGRAWTQFKHEYLWESRHFLKQHIPGSRK